MDHDEICAHLVKAGYKACLSADKTRIAITFFAGGRECTLDHPFPQRILALPRFALAKPETFHSLAHVVVNPKTGLGDVCIGDADSISVNTDVPELAYEVAVERHVTLLTRLIQDPGYNREELLREFHSNWEELGKQFGAKSGDLYVIVDKPGA